MCGVKAISFSHHYVPVIQYQNERNKSTGLVKLVQTTHCAQSLQYYCSFCYPSTHAMFDQPVQRLLGSTRTRRTSYQQKGVLSKVFTDLALLSIVRVRIQQEDTELVRTF